MYFQVVICILVSGQQGKSQNKRYLIDLSLICLRLAYIRFSQDLLIDLIFNFFLLVWYLQDGVSYIRVFVGIVRDISKQETVEYMLAMVDEMLAGDTP